MASPDIYSSIVVYKNPPDILSRCVESIIHSSVKVKPFIIDNSPSEVYQKLSEKYGVEYLCNRKNIGFGRAHNVAIRKSVEDDIPYHLVINPDVYFEKGTLEKLLDFMQACPDVGLSMPRVLYSDGSIQYLCKLLPTPADLIRRRFFPPSAYADKKNRLYELRFTGYDKTMDVPFLSGCFMLMRTAALRRAGLFDERFFLYLEDVDLCRRIHRHYRTVYYPEASVFHEYKKGSYENGRLLMYHVWSAFRYFNKWGYFFDSDRRVMNEAILKKLSAI